MHYLIRSARVVDPFSDLNGQVVDLRIDNGLIRQIGPALPADGAVRELSAGNLHVSPGWLDLRVSVKDPGYEHKETLDSACRAAAAGGFTDVAVLPGTKPTLDSKDTLGYVRRMAEGQPVTVHPIAAVTKGTAGEDFAEMIDLHHAGAVAFSDGEHPLHNPDLLLKTLYYLRPFGGLLMQRPEEPTLTRFGQMHEGVQSTLLGLRGMPALAEELIIERDLRLLAYALDGQQASDHGPVLHFSTISSARSVELIRQAKAQGLPVSCDVAAHQLVFDDTALVSFDTNLKVNPPFRTKTDVAALWAGLANGTIDAVVSDHNPQDEESKNVEFDQADFGMTGLETVFSQLLMHNHGLSLEQLIRALSHRPRQILRLPVGCVAEGQPATLTLFDPTTTWTYERTASRSRNTPWLGRTLTGRVVGILNAGRWWGLTE